MNSHDHTMRAGRRHRTPLVIAFALVAGVMVVEAVGGWLTGSLALIGDAGHMATDALGLAMALAAVVAADRARSAPSRTYGMYRTEILAALANAILLFAVAGYVITEAIRRLDARPEIITGPMAVIAAVGLVVNIVAWRLLRRGAAESLNVEGAYVEVVADLVGSIGVLAAAGIISVTGWTIVDPIVGAAIGVFILPRAWHLARKALRILIQAAPPDLDLTRLQTELQALHGVMDVHDFHVWTLTSDMEVATVHLMTCEDTDAHPILDEARAILERAGVAHATLQVEPQSHVGCAEICW